MTDWICSTGSSLPVTDEEATRILRLCSWHTEGIQRQQVDIRFYCAVSFSSRGKTQQGSPLSKLSGVWYSMATLWVLIHSIKRFIALAGCKLYTYWTAPHSVFCPFTPSILLSTLGYFMDLEPCSSCLPLTGLFQLW